MIEAVVYFAPSCPGGTWTPEQTHRWNVSIARPDLIVDDILTTPANPIQGQSTTIHAWVLNQGNADAPAFDIRYTVNGSTIGTDELSFGLNAGDDDEETISHTFTATGANTVCVTADLNAEVTESNEGNNTRCETVIVNAPPRPDLVIDDIWTTPSNPIQGQSVTIGTRVSNQGNADAPAFDIRYTVNGTAFGTDRLSLGLDAGDDDDGESIPHTFTASGTNTVCVTADINGEVTESNEGNNSRCESITVGAPVGSLAITVRNWSGNTQAGALCRLYNNSNPWGFLTQGTTNGSGVVTFSNLSPGIYNYEVYYTGTQWGEEFWGDGTATVVVGQTTPSPFTRHMPRVNGTISFDRWTGSAWSAIAPGSTIPMGTQVRARVPVINGNSNNLRCGLILHLDRSQSAGYDHTFDVAPTVWINSGQSGVVVSTGQTINTVGTYSFALEELTTLLLNGNEAPTDATNWMTGFTVAVANPLPDDMWTVITHGYVGSDTAWMLDVAGWIETLDPGNVLIHEAVPDSFAMDNENLDSNKHHVLLWDWTETANLPFVWPPPIDDSGHGYAFASGDALYAYLRYWGLEQKVKCLLGYSRGAVVMSEAARRLILDGYPVDQVIYLDGEGRGYVALPNQDVAIVPYVDDRFDAWQSPIEPRWTNVLTTFHEERIPLGGNERSRCCNLNLGNDYSHSGPGFGCPLPCPPSVVETLQSISYDGDYYVLPGVCVPPSMNERDPHDWHGVTHNSDAVLFNGNFEWGSRAGWAGHGGGGSGDIDWDDGGFLELDQNGDDYWLQHNWFWLREEYTRFTLRYRVSNADGFNCDDKFKVTLERREEGVEPKTWMVTDKCATTPWYTFSDEVPPAFRGAVCRLRLWKDAGPGGGIDAEVLVDDVGFLACVPPNPPSNAQGSAERVCLGTVVTLTASVPGAVIDWYANGCGVNPVDAGNVVDVTPQASTTYYARSRNATTGCVSSTCDSVPVLVVNPADCDDGVFCNGEESCSSGNCVSPGNPCALIGMACNEGTDSCVDCLNDGDCDDADPCTDDDCAGGQCEFTFNPGNCPEPTGACCLENGTCQSGVTQEVCGSQGGQYQGGGTTCALVECVGCGNDECDAGETCETCPLDCGDCIGACCVDGDTCVLDVTEASCTSQGGDWEGPDTTSCADCSPEPVCSVSPTSLDFGIAVVGTPKDRTFTITNIGGGTLSGTVTEPCPDYTIPGGAVYSLGAGQSQTVIVRFTPSSEGTKNCTVNVGNGCSSVGCTGVGEIQGGPVCSVAPTTLNFGTVEVGDSTDRTFTITNTGTGTLSGSVSESCSHYSIVSGGGAYNLGAGLSRTVTVRFAPTSTGTKTCTISPTGGCASVSCTGVGCTPPGQPMSPSPADGATGVSRDADLAWAPVPGAILYEVYLGTNPDPNLLDYLGETTASFWTLNRLSPGTKYYWGVGVFNGCEWNGNLWSFTTAADPVGCGNGQCDPGETWCSCSADCPLIDSDGDGRADCVDGCPNDPNKTAAGQCGCGFVETDSDMDGVPNCNDSCPDDASNNCGQPPPCGDEGCGGGMLGMMPMSLACLVWAKRRRRLSI